MENRALELIRENREKHKRGDYAGELNLENCNLTSLPQELLECVWLERLILGTKTSNNDIVVTIPGAYNNLESLEGLQLLTNLKELVVGSRFSHKPVMDLTPIGQLRQLEELQLVQCNIKSFEPLIKLNKLKSLNLSLCSMEDIGSLNRLKSITSLTAFQSGINSIEIVSGLISLEKLYLPQSNISTISSIINLINLKELNLSFSEISDITPLSTLKKLVSLDLSFNKITDIRALEKLSKMNDLNLSHNKIVNLSPISKLQSIKKLDISGTAIVNIQDLSGLVSLKNLSFSNTAVTDLHPVSVMGRLETLNCSKTRISEITPLSFLLNLKFLNIGYNKVQDINPISKLTRLIDLSMEETDIDDISPVSSLKKLEVLDISRTSVINMSPISQLSRLNKFYASNCKIKKIKNLPLKAPITLLRLDNNPIKDCPANIWGLNDISLIRDYFESLKTTNKEIFFEIKLIILGNGSVGKTQLANLMTTGKYNDDTNSTHGINVIKWIPGRKSHHAVRNLKDNLRINIWDFGGQEYYHGTHKLFLSNDAVYILLWDRQTNTYRLPDGSEKNEELHFNYEYWLESIRHYAKNSPVILVQNKVDDPAVDRERPDNEVLSIYNVSQECYIRLNMADSNERKFKRLYDRFMEDLAELIDTVKKGFEISNVWIDIRNEIQKFENGESSRFDKISETNPVIDVNEFKKICDDISVSNGETTIDETRLKSILSWLHEIGAIVFYPDNPALKDTVFLKPLWITEGIYTILNCDILTNKGEPGVVKSDGNKMFIDLMLHMNLIFSHPKDKEKYIAPQYLPIEHPDDSLFKIAEKGLVQSSFRIQIPLFYYRKLMQSIIIFYGLSSLFYHKYYWKNGVLFTGWDGIRFLIKGEESDGTILIGTDTNRDMEMNQTTIFSQILDFLFDPTANNSSISKHGVQNQDISQLLSPELITIIESHETEPDKVPVWLKEMKVEVNNTGFVGYLNLWAAAKDKHTKIKSSNSKENFIYEYSKLLVNIKTITRPLKVFLSYSHANHELMKRMVVHLSALKRLDRIETWTDCEILPGANWDDTIKSKIGNADIILLLISADFVASKYIWENEVGRALKRANRKECLVIPILLEPTDFEGLGFAEKQMIPSVDGKLNAITVWNNREEGFAETARSVRGVVNNFEMLLKTGIYM